MFIYETADQKEVRRFRIAQFNGRPATVRDGKGTITGQVRSVVEKAASAPPCWAITIVPAAQKPETIAARRTPRLSWFAENDSH